MVSWLAKDSSHARRAGPASKLHEGLQGGQTVLVKGSQLVECMAKDDRRLESNEQSVACLPPAAHLHEPDQGGDRGTDVVHA